MTARPPPLTASAFCRMTGISHEVLERLEAYLALLATWQSRINLVGRASLDDPWRRHVLDSAQLHPHLDGARTLLDIGSGAGFPGLVLAILGAPGVHLVESNGRKCTFLEEVNRVTEAGAVIHNRRIEDMESLAVDVVTARAFAPLDRILLCAEPFLDAAGRCLLLKGRKVDEELTESKKSWNMQVTRIESLSDSSGTILKLGGISRHHGY